MSTILLLSTPIFAADATDDYIFFRLWGYGNDSASYDIDNYYRPFSAERIHDIADIGEWWGEPYDDASSPTLSLSILDKRLQPGPNWETSVRVGVGEYGNFNRTLLSGGVLGDSRYSLTFAFDEQGSEGYSDNLFLLSDTVADNIAQFGRLRVGYEGEIFEASLQLTQAETDRGDDRIFLSALPERLTISDVEGFRDSKEKSSILNMQWQLNEDWSLTSRSSHLRTENGTFQDIDRTPIPLEFFFFVSSADRYAQNFKIENLNNDGDTFLLSLNYIYEESQNNSITTGLLLAPVFNEQVFLALIEIQEIQQYNFQIAKDWKLQDEGYFSFKIEYQDYSLERAAVDLASVINFVDENDVLRVSFVNPDFSQWLISTLFDYPLTEDASLSLSYQQNFTPGGVSSNLVSGVRLPYQQQLESRYDFGIYSTGFDSNINFSFNIFYSQFKNIQVPVFGDRENPFDIGIINASSASSRGFEIEFEYLPIDTVRIALENVFQKTRYHDFPNSFKNLNGNQFIYEPRITTSGSVLWQISDQFIFSFQQIFKGSKYSDAVNNSIDKIESSNISNIKY
jgi:outer membrane receptor protein involved in Fe transport